MTASAGGRITLWTHPGSLLHCELCDAFLEGGGYILLHDALHEVLTMESPLDVPRTCWRLRTATCAGAS